MTSCRPSAALRCLRLAVPRGSPWAFAPPGRAPRQAWSWPGSSGRDFAEETTGSPKFLGNPKCPFARFSRRRQDCGHQTYGAAAWPLVCEKQRLPRKVFRRSIAWLSDSLSTLRRAGYPARRKTRFQPLVRRYWTGFYPQGSTKGFRGASYIPSSFPKLCLAQSPFILPGRFYLNFGSTLSAKR